MSEEKPCGPEIRRVTDVLNRMKDCAAEIDADGESETKSDSPEETPRLALPTEAELAQWRRDGRMYPMNIRGDRLTAAAQLARDLVGELKQLQLGALGHKIVCVGRIRRDECSCGRDAAVDRLTDLLRMVDL